MFYKIWIIIYMYGITQNIFLKYQKQYTFCFCCTKEVSLSDVKGQDWKKYFQKQISHVCAGWLCAIIGLSLICPCKWCSLDCTGHSLGVLMLWQQLHCSPWCPQWGLGSIVLKFLPFSNLHQISEPRCPHEALTPLFPRRDCSCLP